MSLRSRWTTSWSTFQAALSVMTREKKLLVFPAMTAGLMIVIAVFCLAPLLFWPTGHHLNEMAHWQAVGSSLTSMFIVDSAAAVSQHQQYHNTTLVLSKTGYTYLGVAYFLSMFLVTFFNVAFFSEIIRALRGETVSIARGLRFAVQRWRPILLWSLVAGVIGFLIRMLSERLGLVGRIVISFIGLAWSVATVFAIPVLIMEPVLNPFVILRQSAMTIKKTWGESLIGYLGFQLGGLVIVLSSLVLLSMVVVVAIGSQTPLLLGAGCVIWLIALIAFIYVTSVANRVFQCGLYLYASDGVVPEPFNQNMFNAAWKIKAN